MQTRIIREDEKGPFIKVGPTVYRPEAQFVESTKKRVGQKVGIQQSASRLFGSILFILAPNMKFKWSWRPEQYVGAVQPPQHVTAKKFDEVLDMLKKHAEQNPNATVQTFFGFGSQK